MNAVKEMKPPKHFLPEMLNKIVVHSLDRSDEDKELASVLIHELCTEGIITSEQLMQVCLAWGPSPHLWYRFYCLGLRTLFSPIGCFECFGSMSQHRGRSPAGEVLPGPVCSTCNHCWPGQHHRFGPPAGEWCTFPTVLALLTAADEAEGPRVAFRTLPAEQNQHAENATWYEQAHACCSVILGCLCYYSHSF